MYALNAKTGAKLWSYTTGDEVDSSPAVANGVVYVGSDDYVLVRTEHQHRRQAVELPHRLLMYSSPAVVDGVVYVGSFDHNVYALNASTGAMLWSYNTGSVVYSAPAVANGVVYVGSWDHRSVRVGRSRPVLSSGVTRLAASLIPRPPWPMEWRMSAPTTKTFTR